MKDIAMAQIPYCSAPSLWTVNGMMKKPMIARDTMRSTRLPDPRTSCFREYSLRCSCFETVAATLVKLPGRRVDVHTSCIAVHLTGQSSPARWTHLILQFGGKEKEIGGRSVQMFAPETPWKERFLLPD